MNSRYILLVGTIAALLLVGCTVAGTAVAQDSQQDRDVVMTVDIDEEGNATWSVQYRVRLENESQTEAFQSYLDDIEGNETRYEDRFESRMAPLLTSAENRTNRSMSIQNVSVSGEIRNVPKKYGVVEYRFEWTSFAIAENDSIKAGSAVEGLVIDDSTTLVMEFPEQYTVKSVTPTADEQLNQSVTWRGAEEFDEGEPLIVAQRDTETQSEPKESEDDEDEGSLVGVFAIVGLLCLGVVGAIVAFVRSRDDSSGETERVMSDEEKVLALFDEGEQMKQQDIVDELGWSDAKTSRVVSELREDGRLDGFRLGRENVLELPEEEEED